MRRNHHDDTVSDLVPDQHVTIDPVRVHTDTEHRLAPHLGRLDPPRLRLERGPVRERGHERRRR